MPISVWNVLEDQSLRGERAIAILGQGRTPLTYGALRRQCAETVAVLNRAGIGRGDRVAIVLPNGPEMAAAFLGVSAGASSAPLNPAYTREELAFYLSDLNARGVIVQRGLESPVRDIAEEQGITLFELVPDSETAGGFVLHAERGSEPCPDGFALPSDEALVLHTSGTTARPKIVPLTQANLTASARNIAASLALSGSDRCLNVMPLFHIHGLVGALLSSLSAGAGIFCTPGFSAPDFLGLLTDSGATWYTAVPTMHQAIVERSAANPDGPGRHGLRFIRSCSSALAPKLMADLERTFGVPVVEAYGMTEGSHQIAVNPLPPRIRKPGSVGIPAGTSVAVLDAEGRRLGCGETGELAIAGEGVTAGYASNPAANAAAFSDGFFRTGDQGHVDADGYVFITGRMKEIINKGGEKIAPREIDEVLLLHPAIAQCVAFAAPHPRLGEEVAAAIVVRPGFTVTPAEVRDFAGRHLAGFKVPRRVLVLPDLPKGPTGKLQRVGLAARLGVSFDASAQAGGGAAITGDEAAIARLMADVLRVPSVGAEDDFFEIGGESILALELSLRISDELQVEVRTDHIYRYASARELAAALPGLREAPGADAGLEDRPLAFNEGGGRTPFFFVHAGNVSASFCQRLADRLGPDQPVYGLPLYGGDFGPVPVTVEAMATRYVELIERWRPDGPIAIGGFCRSALPAFEAAQRLRAKGRPVERLVLIGGQLENTRGPWAQLQRLTDAVSRITGGDDDTRIGRFLQLRRTLDVVHSRLTGRAPAADVCRPSTDPDPHVRIPLQYARARAAYVPRPYAGPVTCLSIASDPQDPRWSTVAPRRDYGEVPGDHRTAFTTHAPALSDAIGRALAGPRPGSSQPASPQVPAVAGVSS